MGFKLDLIKKLLKFITKTEIKQPIKEAMKKIVPPKVPKTKVYIPPVAYNKATQMYSWVNPGGNTIYWQRYEQKSISHLMIELSKKIVSAKSDEMARGLKAEKMVLDILEKKMPQSEILGAGIVFFSKKEMRLDLRGDIDIATSFFNVEVKASLAVLKLKQLTNNPKSLDFYNYNYKPTVVIITNPNTKFKHLWGAEADVHKADLVKTALNNGIYIITTDKEGMAVLDKLIANRHLLKFKPTHANSFKLYEFPKATSITATNTNRRPVLKLKP